MAQGIRIIYHYDLLIFIFSNVRKSFFKWFSGFFLHLVLFFSFTWFFFDFLHLVLFWKLYVMNCSFVKFHQFIYWAVHFIIDSYCRCPNRGGVGRPAPGGASPFGQMRRPRPRLIFGLCMRPKKRLLQRTSSAQWTNTSFMPFNDSRHLPLWFVLYIFRFYSLFTWGLCIRSVFCVFKTFYLVLPIFRFLSYPILCILFYLFVLHDIFVSFPYFVFLKRFTWFYQYFVFIPSHFVYFVLPVYLGFLNIHLKISHHSFFLLRHFKHPTYFELYTHF